MSELKAQMAYKYVICPGFVQSKNDRQRHYISATQLMRLYGVKPHECLIHEPQPWWTPAQHRMAEEQQKDLPRLGPRYHGDYTLP